MSVRNLEKMLICSSALTGEVFFQMPLDDFLNSQCAENYFYYQCSKYIENEEGCIIKIGYKS